MSATSNIRSLFIISTRHLRKIQAISVAHCIEFWINTSTSSKLFSAWRQILTRSFPFGTVGQVMGRAFSPSVLKRAANGWGCDVIKGTIGVDTTSGGVDIYGGPQQCSWTQFIPVPGDVGLNRVARVVTHVSKARADFSVIQRSDLIEHSDILILEIGRACFRVIVACAPWRVEPAWSCTDCSLSAWAWEESSEIAWWPW